jgi:hypothetical protein
LRTGFVRGSFDAPVQATSEFRNFRNGVFSNGASVDGIVPSRVFWTFADAFTGIAVANPYSSSVNCVGIFVESEGQAIRQIAINLGQLSQISFTLGAALSLAPDAVGSFQIVCPLEVVSLAIAGNALGITSSLPSGAWKVPANHLAAIQKVFKQLVRSANSVGLTIGQPNLQFVTELNAYAQASTNTVSIGLALAELLADSESELAHVIGHELGHIYQYQHGLEFHPNAELDADLFGVMAALSAGYDPYGAAGLMGKLMMVTGRTNPLIQIFDNLTDPHTSFSFRMENIFSEISYQCSLPAQIQLCADYHDIVHPHLVAPLDTAAPGYE